MPAQNGPLGSPRPQLPAEPSDEPTEEPVSDKTLDVEPLHFEHLGLTQTAITQGIAAAQRHSQRQDAQRARALARAWVYRKRARANHELYEQSAAMWRTQSHKLLDLEELVKQEQADSAALQRHIDEAHAELDKLGVDRRTRDGARQTLAVRIQQAAQRLQTGPPRRQSEEVSS